MFALDLLLGLALAGAPFPVQEAAATADQGALRVDEKRGFQIRVPEGWSATELGEQAEAFHVLQLSEVASAGMVGVAVRLSHVSEEVPAGSFVDLARSSSDARADLVDFEERSGDLLGSEVPGFRVTLVQPSGPRIRIAQLVLEQGDLRFVLQCHAPEDAYEGLAATFTATLATFALLDPERERSAAVQREELLEALAARCGSEVDWAASWEEAARRAEAEGKPVLVVIWMYAGFQGLPTPRATLFSDREFLALLERRVVPLWFRRGDSSPLERRARYGLGPHAFGRALMLVSPEGEVLAETASLDPVSAYAFLRTAPLPEGMPAGLRADAASEGDPESELERAREALAAGDLEQVARLTADRADAPALLVRATAARLELDAEAASAALAKARAALPAPTPELLLEEARVAQGRGERAAAMALLDELLATTLEADDPGEETPEALLLRWMLALGAEPKEGVDPHADAELLVARFPDHPAAWQAATLLASPLLDLIGEALLRWPERDVIDETTAASARPYPGAPATEAARDPARAHAEALAFLLARQRTDGSWPSPTEISKRASEPDPFVEAMTAIASRALLGASDAEEVQAAAERGLAFALASAERRAREEPTVVYMDYLPWADAAMLELFASVLERGAGSVPVERLHEASNALVADLEKRQVEGGGWSYYLTSDPENDTVGRQSISFTTAAVVQALTRARAAGVEVPEEFFATAAEALAAMRNADEVFDYFLFHDAPNTPQGTPIAGAAGRGPACELALLPTEHGSLEHLERALRLFLLHADTYSAERGKAIMHAGDQGQGCHYLLFDYANAARAVATLPLAKEGRARVLELVLDCRLSDGSFRDSPILGRSYGTAMALLALADLGHAGG